MAPGSMRTVNGDVPIDELSGALTHEHVDTLVPGSSRESYLSGGAANDRLEMAVRALAPLKNAGVNTLVNLAGSTHLGQYWVPGFLREVSALTGIHIVAGFGYYTERAWPAGIGELTHAQLVDRFIEAAGQIGDSGVPAGAYGEIATGFNCITDGEERILRAVAHAQRHTGLPIMTHASLGTMVPEQVRILADAGADLEQVVIGHVHLHPDPDYIESALQEGATVAFDTLGKQHFDYRLSAGDAGQPGVKRAEFRPDEDRLGCLIELVRRGWSRQIVLASDLTGAETFANPETHGRHGYAFVPELILPQLRTRGLSAEAVQDLLVNNPRRILAIR